MNEGVEDIFRPWPLRRICERLSADDTLWKLCQPRTTARPFDTRELTLESLVRDVLSEQMNAENVTVRRRIGTTLRLRNAPFPANAQPDVVAELDGEYHICEVKSGRTDYGRFDCVFESVPFQEYLADLGHTGKDPWEVEQDLIKLHRFPELSREIGSCLFLMVDSYAGSGRSWSKAFSDLGAFRATMRTELVRTWGEELLARTMLTPIQSTTIKANLIACAVYPHAQSNYASR